MKVLLIDDHALFREAVSLLIGQRFPQLRLLEAGSIGDAVIVAREHPDLRLALLDLGLPDSDGLHSLTALREAVSLMTVVVLSADTRAETILAAIDAGAAGFIPKTAQGSDLIDALQTVLDGGVYLPAEALEPGAPRDDSQAVLRELSTRQVDVLRLLIEGKTNKLICRELGLSESTVKTHVAAIFRRLSVNNRTQAVLASARLGLRWPRET